MISHYRNIKSHYRKLKIAIVGLGYVGLPLALEFSKKKKVIGFDISNKRIRELNAGIDCNLEFTSKELKISKKLIFTKKIDDLKSCNCFILTVPTPVDKFKKPDLKLLFSATKLIAKILKKNDLVIYESTVYPGCIEEECVPILEKFSKLTYNNEFFCGYSPERINPGDKHHTISNIKKITSGSTEKTAHLVDYLYKKIIKAGTHKTSNIKIAEAAKVIENTQRDLNIALINELSIIFKKLEIDTQSVLEAASTKWNFINFKPGLVGGHCIGVDPYYLTFKSIQAGYKPNIILAGREINDKMGIYVAKNFIKEMKKNKIKIDGSRILIMGLTFKENCADIRNSGVKSVVEELKRYNCKLDLYDPWADSLEIKKSFGITPKNRLTNFSYDGVVLAVAHTKFKKMGKSKILGLCKKNNVIFDLKHLFSKKVFKFRL